MTHERIGAGDLQGYAAYLLRLWREGSGESSRWRASLQDPHSGERLGFASLDQLFEYLLFQTGAVTDVDENYR